LNWPRAGSSAASINGVRRFWRGGTSPLPARCREFISISLSDASFARIIAWSAEATRSRRATGSSDASLSNSCAGLGTARSSEASTTRQGVTGLNLTTLLSKGNIGWTS
jgi:hypothetical protein